MSIDVFGLEDRTFPPPDDFAANALLSDRSLYEEADRDVEAFWAKQARQLLTWQRVFVTVLEWDLPFAKWFIGWQLEVRQNCHDRLILLGRGGRVGIPLE